MSLLLVVVSLLALLSPSAEIFSANNSCEALECPPLDCPEDLLTLDTVCGRCPTCARRWQRMSCGGPDNIQCSPGFICRYRLGTMLGVEKMGLCESVKCSTIRCGFRQYCEVSNVYAKRDHNEQLPYCACHRPWQLCDGKDNPLCGYDNRTYPSLCRLWAVECGHGRFIGVKHMGRCHKDHYPVDPEVPPYSQPLDNSIAVPTPKRVEPCIYYGRTFLPDTTRRLWNNPCKAVVCDRNGILSIVDVPGCPGKRIDDIPDVTKPPVHGGWTRWSEWSSCNDGCYNSTRTRRRSCTSPSPRYEGRPCVGPEEQTVRCYPPGCNITCDYTRWTAWSECSVTCGGVPGTATRSRGISNSQDEEVTRRGCDLVETRECLFERDCPNVGGPCRKLSLGKERRNFDHIPLMKFGYRCQTTLKYEVKYCGGRCDGVYKNGTQCSCKPTKYRLSKKRYFQIKCGWPFYWRSPVPIITRCGCVLEGEEAVLPLPDDEPGNPFKNFPNWESYDEEDWYEYLIG